MHPKRFVTLSALVETRPIRCRRIWRRTHYWLSSSRKLRCLWIHVLKDGPTNQTFFGPLWIHQTVRLVNLGSCGLSFAVCRQESVAGLLKNMFEGERSEASIVNGTQVLLTLLETRRSGWVSQVLSVMLVHLSSAPNLSAWKKMNNKQRGKKERHKTKRAELHT